MEQTHLYFTWYIPYICIRKPYALVVIECAPTAVKIIYRLWLQKFVPTVSSHSLARVQGMVYIVLSMSKGAGHGLNS